MGVYGIAVLSFFSNGISKILSLMCGIAVSWALRYAVFHPSGWRYSVKEDPSRYCATVHLASVSTVFQYLEDFRLNGKWVHNFWQLNLPMMKFVGHLMTWLSFRSLYWSILTFFREGWGWFLVYTCLRY